MRPVFSRAPSLLFGCTLLFFAACQGADKSDGADGLADEELPPECAPNKEEALRQKIAGSVSRIRIGRQHADLKLMDTNARTLSQLERCGEAFDRLCDAACSVERASVHLFRSAAIPLLASKAAAVSTAEPTLLAEADQGLKIVQRALDRLPRQRGFQAGANVNDKAGDGGYNAYLRALTSLYAIRAELQMTSGDIYYRRVSSANTKAISAFVDEVMGDARAGGNDADLERTQASFYYEQAYWTLLEARTSLPGDLNASTTFAGELTRIYDLTQQVGERLRSLREGKLYIGIDPNGLQSGARPNPNSMAALSEQLEKQRLDLRQTEGEVASTMKDWAEQSQELAGIGDQMAELKSSRAIDLEVHKMQELHERTEAVAGPIKSAIEQRSLELDAFALQGRVDALTLQLAIAKKGFENDLAALAFQREEDLIDKDVEGTRLDLDVVRNAIETTMAEYNFLMQQRALEQQQRDLEHSRTQERGNLEALDAQLNEADAEIARQRLEITRLGQETEAIGQRQNEVIANQVAGLQRQQEGMRADLAFYEQNTQLQADICARRAELETRRASDLQEIARCLTAGGGCAGQSLSQIYQQLLDTKKQRVGKAQEEARTTKQLLEQRIRDADRAFTLWAADAGARTAALVAATAAGVAAALVPEVTVGVAGLGPMATTTIKPFQAVQAAMEGAKEIASIAAEGIQFKYSVQDGIAQARIQLASAERQLAEIDLDKLIAELEQKQALAELNVRLLDTQEQETAARNQLRVQTVECQQGAAQNNASLGRARAEIAALDSQIKSLSGERGILDVERRQTDNLSQQAQTTIRKLEAQKVELAVRKQQASTAIQHYEEAARAVQAQLREVSGFQGKVQNLETQRDALQRQLMQHVEQVSLVRLKANDAQRRFIQQAIVDAEKATFEQVSTLRKQLETNAALQKLSAELASVEEEARVQLRVQREALMKLLNDRPLPTVATVIWDFEDISSQLTRGATELLEYKRSLLESTNYYYNAYRYRYNMLSEFVGKSAVPDDQPYIWTAADASKKLAQCSVLGTSPYCSVSSLANEATELSMTSSTFRIPPSSPMFQELLRTGRTRFEFADFARDPDESHNLGDFVMWDKSNMGGEMRVVTFYLSFPQLASCLPTDLRIRHTGLGYQLGEKGDVSLVVRAPVKARPSIIAGSNSDGTDLEVRRRLGRLTQDSLTVMQLDRRFEDGAEGTLAFLGYPLRGVYELVNEREGTGCLEQVSELNLTVVYARR